MYVDKMTRAEMLGWLMSRSIVYDYAHLESTEKLQEWVKYELEVHGEDNDR